MDSIALAWWKRPRFAITIDYGQLPASAEVSAAASVCAVLGIEHHVLQIDCRPLGSGDMAGCAPNPHAPGSDWWPYRNQMLVTFAAMRAIHLGANELMLGTVASDGSHRDGTARFVAQMSALLSMQEGGMTLAAPAIRMSTVDLILRSGIPQSQLAWAHSCHKANVPCGNCRGCNKYSHTLEALARELDRPSGTASPA
jgi:7-cyano-7-deazaguanine synthase